MQGEMASDFEKHDHADSQTENTDSILETMMAYSEIWAIINLLEDSYVLRIPHQVKAFFEEERLKDYEPSIDIDIPLTEQNLQRKTIVLLALLNVNYWCDTEEEREVWLREMAKNDHKEYNPHDTSWDLSRIFDNSENVYENNEEYTRGAIKLSDSVNNNQSVTRPLLVETLMGEINVTEEPIILKRCQICACDPQVALENCISITQKEEFSPYLTVKNLGLGDVVVVKILSRGEDVSFELDENVSFRISGNASIETEVYEYNSKSSDSAIKSIIKIGIVAHDECKVYLSFHNGDSCNLKSGESIIPKVGNSEDRAILRCKIDDWDDGDWW